MRALRHLVIALGALSLAACGGKNAPITQEDMAIGPANAPVTVVEYASVACPGCADFNNRNWAELKKKYIDSGQVRWVVKEMFTHDAAWAAAGFMTARCLGKDKYFEAIDKMYHAAPDIDASGDRLGGLGKVAASMGMSDKQFHDCVSDEQAMTAMNARVEENMRTPGVNGTPFFFINGEPYERDLSLEAFSAAIEAAKSKPKQG